MPNYANHRIAATAARQYGVFSRSDASEAGLTRDVLNYGVESGRYRRVHPSVFVMAGSPTSWRQRMMAAVLSFPELAAVSHQTAANLWGLTDRSTRAIDIVTIRWDRVLRDDLRIHESLDLLPVDVVDLDGIPVTSPVRTVVDLGASNRWIVESALEQGIRRGLFTLDQVDAFVRRVARRGRRGVGVIRPLLKARRRWDTTTESALEDEFRKLIADWGLPMPELQYEVRDELGILVSRADFAYPEHRILIELDSEAHHMDRLTFRRDRTKQNRAVVLGWTVLRYTWWDIVEAPARVVQDLQGAIGTLR